MDPNNKSVLISGATGLLGEYLCRFFTKEGWQVRGLARNPSLNPFSPKEIPFFTCDLPDFIDESAFEGIDVFIHCAYMTRFTNLGEAKRVNEEGTKRLHELCKQRRIHFVFISSTAAHENAHSYYGKSKFKIEKMLDKTKDLIIKPGLILANANKGLFHRIQKTLKSHRIVPNFGAGHSMVQTIHIDDLCQAIHLAISKALTGSYVVAETEGISANDLWQLISKKLGKKPLFIPLPYTPLITIARIFECFKLKLPFSSENLLGLKYSKVIPSEKDQKTIGFTATPAKKSIDRLLF